MPVVSGNIGSSTVSIEMGDMTSKAVDAYVIPEFQKGASYGGVGGAVARNGGVAGLEAYSSYIEEQGARQFGEAIMTPSGGGNGSAHLHVVSVGGDEEDEFGVVKQGFYNALKLAERHGFKDIAAPALGTGIIGSLTGTQSAQALMSAIDKYSEEGGRALQVGFVIYGDSRAFAQFTDVLTKGSYKEAAAQIGSKQFDEEAYRIGLQEMRETQDRLRPAKGFTKPAAGG